MSSPKRRKNPNVTRRRAAKARYCFVFGGVLSGVGKGTAVSSIGRILLSKGFTVAAMKIDPYLNVDAGTMNPTEHGEVFVTKDGMETDQDLGNYERFLGVETTRANYMTSGQVYLSVIEQERNLEYGGKCVEPFYHVPQEAIKRIHALARNSKADIILIEVGGTVGEYQNHVFLEAARMMAMKEPGAVQFLMVSYLPVPSKIGEMKTKPTQNAVQLLNSAGIRADFLLCRSIQPLDQRRREKLSMFCNLPPENVISAPDVESIYDIPVNLNREKIGEKILAGFGLLPRRRDLQQWTAFTERIHRLRKTVRIGIVGKYFSTGSFILSDSYISVIESIKHACWHHGVQPDLQWINAESLEAPEGLEQLKAFQGLIVPGGFGSRGSEGKMAAIRFAREQKIPFFGLCYGMQLAVIEFSRNVLGLRNASSTEIDPKTPHPVIDLMTAQKRNLHDHRYGGTMRLGEYRCALAQGTKARAIYDAKDVMERHRHRYELNNRYRAKLEQAGLLVSGFNPAMRLAEIVELKDHPFFIGVQFHPEFRSQPMQPHPLFAAFIHAAKAHPVLS